MDLAHFRNDFKRERLITDSLNPNPFGQFETWFQMVLDANIGEPNAMSLATATPTARPSLRTVLLKYFATRLRESQIGAWVSQQSNIVSTKSLIL